MNTPEEIRKAISEFLKIEITEVQSTVIQSFVKYSERTKKEKADKILFIAAHAFFISADAEQLLTCAEELYNAWDKKYNQPNPQ